MITVPLFLIFGFQKEPPPKIERAKGYLLLGKRVGAQKAGTTPAAKRLKSAVPSWRFRA